MRGRLPVPPSDMDIAPADPVSTVIAIPVCGAAPGLLHCLRSLGRQRCAPSFGVLLLLQNCGPATLRLVGALAILVPYRLRLVEIDVRGGDAHIGWARRLAMDAAAQWLEDSGSVGGTILTIDADAVVPPDWLARNYAALDGGADCVVGGIDYADDNGRRLPAGQQRRLRLEADYAVLLARIRSHFEPAAGASANRQGFASTGSLAVPLMVYRANGRIAPFAHGAKRAFAEAVEAGGGSVRYAAGVRVLLPARRNAPSAMPRFEPVAAAVRRAQWRARLRKLFQGRTRAEAPGWVAADLPEGLAKAAAEAPNFAVAWRVIEGGSPLLRQPSPSPASLPAEIAAARKVVAALAAKEAMTRTEVAPISDVVKMRVSRLIAASAIKLRGEPLTA